jgi:small multidrug resistance pump
MQFLYLTIAIATEVIGTMNMKRSEGFTRLIPTLMMVLCYVISFTGLALTLRKLDVGVAYAIWAGVGTGLVALAGMIYFGEAVTWLRLLSVAAIMAGVIGLNLAGGTH